MEKINIAELLRDCPKGMELDSTLLEGLEFDSIVDNDYLPIRCRIKNPNGGYNVYNFTKHGCWFDSAFAKCLIFPKGKTTWEGFQRPFVEGDIVSTTNGKWLGIVKKAFGDGYETYISIDYKNFIYNDDSVFCFDRLATEEEKQKLFDAIKANGYRWNAETKTLKKLVEPKFDINTLVPFESKVLIRNVENQRWIPAFWGYKVVNGFITTFGWCQYCIPYEGNEHLLNTANDCDSFYKTWE